MRLGELGGVTGRRLGMVSGEGTGSGDRPEVQEEGHPPVRILAEPPARPPTPLLQNSANTPENNGNSRVHEQSETSEFSGILAERATASLEELSRWAADEMQGEVRSEVSRTVMNI